MGCAKYIGRVGALAVALGVGLAIAGTPAVASAGPSDSSSSTSDSSSTNKPSASTGTSSSTKTASTGGEPSSTDQSDGTDSSPSKTGPPSGSTDGSDADADGPADEATEDGDTEEADGVGPTSDEDSEEAPPATSDEDTPSADPRSGLADTTVKVSASDDSADQHASSGHGFRTPDTAGADPTSSLAATVGQPTAPSPSASKQSQMQRAAAVDDTPTTNSSARSFTTAATTFTAATFTATSFAADSAPAEPQQHPTIISVITDLVAAVLQPFMNPGTGLSFPASLLVGVLSAVRNEIERALRRTAPAASQYTVSQIAGPSLLADPTPNVLLIGVDGTNLSRILADDENDNFFALMDDGTTAASSIVGHTTISNPSWTSILTGVWGERAGVINNVFTPWTYDNWPTVFNQLETYNPNIDTTTIADWNVINAISGAGSIPVDTNIYVPQIEGDTNWSQTDDAVGHATVDAIENTAADTPSFVFSYFVGVDENGHMHGGASPEYAEAIRNVDDNLGDILDAVALWEADNPGEEWTIIVVTDHGHQPQQGFGHGFQTPDETATFVIARGPDFNDGFVNPDYEIVDTTPTVLSLFGASPLAHADGVSLTTLGGSDADPGPGNLHQALEAMIATNHSPDIVTDVALSLRTIFATIPYYVWTLTNDGTLPIPILGNVLYVVTNVPAQIVALLTGVTGARFFPLLPPGPPSWPGQEEENAPDTAILACGGPSGLPAESACYASNAV